MGDKENGKADMSGWKAQTNTSDAEVYEQADQVQFFDVPQSHNVMPLGDDDKTPVVRMKRDSITKVGLHDIAAIQAKLRETDIKAAAMRHGEHERQLLRIEKTEIKDIFKAVVDGNEDEIKSLLTRDFGSIPFRSLEDCKSRIEEMLGGENEMEGILNMEKIAAGNKKLAEIVLEMRMNIGDERPVVQITLANEIGHGRRSGENVTVVSSVKKVEKLSPTMPIKPPGILSRLFGKK